MNRKRRIITNPQKIGFNILSSTFKLIKSIIKKTNAPLRAIIIAFINGRKGSNIHNTNKAHKNEEENPAIYPIIVFLLDLGKFFLPKHIPKIDAAASPKVDIRAAAENMLIGKKKIGTNDSTKATGLVNS